MRVRNWYFVLIVSVLCLAFEASANDYGSGGMHHSFSEMEDADENGIPDSLEQYLVNSGISLPAEYAPNESDLDGDGTSDLDEWMMGTDPLTVEQNFTASASAAPNGTGMVLRLTLPDHFGSYAEVFGRESLLHGQWQVVDGWIPTYGTTKLELVISTESNNTYFVIGSDATIDSDMDGYSDWMERYVTFTDPNVFDSPNEDGDDLPDFWELKLFGSIWTQDGFDDSDGDSLLNNQELVWLPGNIILMFSDPSLADTDGDGLDDGEEVNIYHTDPLLADSDGDGLDDALELLVLRTDPNNPDTLPPVINF